MRQTPVTAIDPPPPVELDLKPRRRLAATQAMFVGLALLIAGQLVRWTVFDRSALLANMVSGYAFLTEVPSQRGTILDRNYNLLALNNYDYTIEAAPSMIAEDETAAVAAKLAAILERPAAEIQAQLEGDAMYALLARQVPREKGKAIQALHLSGIFVNPLATRIYPEHTLAAHTLGFVAGDEQEGTKGYYGVEGFYDQELKGQAGQREERWDPWAPISFADRRADDWIIPQDGSTLVLTIDRTIQYLIERELIAAVESYGAESGSIVVMDPRTGALIAVASYPNYDPNRFMEAAQEQFVDPVIGVQYEPGSTFKVVTMAAAIDAGAITPSDLYNDVGYIEVGGRIIRNWNERSYGMVTMTEVLVRSLNTGAAHVSTMLGPERFYQYVGRFGFGTGTGIDLQGEATGSVRQPGDAEWHESDLGTNSFGQGLAVTPLQMVVAVGAVANRGVMMRPYVVEALIRDGHEVHAKQVPMGQVISPETARQVTDMMVEAVDVGLPMAHVDGYRIAGKSGTAQTPIVGGYDPELTIASFIGFAPADAPQFVVLVKLDKPTKSPLGAATAAPTFANVARILFTQLRIPPDPSRTAMQ